jgi:hypothetical protein
MSDPVKFTVIHNGKFKDVTRRVCERCGVTFTGFSYEMQCASCETERRLLAYSHFDVADSGWEPVYTRRGVASGHVRNTSSRQDYY